MPRGWQYRVHRCAVCGRPAYYMGNGGRSLCAEHYSQEMRLEKEREEARANHQPIPDPVHQSKQK